MKAIAIVAAVVLGLPAMLVGWAYLHRELFYRQNFAAAYLRHVRVSKSSYRIDPASVRVHPTNPGGYVACGGSDTNGPATLAIQFSITLFGQQEVEYDKWADRWQAGFLKTFCDAKRDL